MILLTSSNARLQVDAFNRNSVPALLGKACAKYNSGNFREALKLYRKVFEVNPCPPPAVRLGLGYCYNKLGQARLARDALKRTLELREDCVDAMVGLAVLHLNDDEVPDALALLKRAYDLEPFNPSVLNHLANHYFYKAQYDRAITLASRAHKCGPPHRTASPLLNVVFPLAPSRVTSTVSNALVHACTCSSVTTCVSTYADAMQARRCESHQGGVLLPYGPLAPCPGRFYQGVAVLPRGDQKQS